MTFLQISFKNIYPLFSASANSCKAGNFFDSQYGSCQPCYPGTYQDSDGQTGCKPCLGGEYSEEGAQSCTMCEKGNSTKYKIYFDMSYFFRNLQCYYSIQ